jgi:hypothetical protein
MSPIQSPDESDQLEVFSRFRKVSRSLVIWKDSLQYGDTTWGQPMSSKRATKVRTLKEIYISNRYRWVVSLTGGHLGLTFEKVRWSDKAIYLSQVENWIANFADKIRGFAMPMFWLETQRRLLDEINCVGEENRRTFGVPNFFLNQD